MSWSARMRNRNWTMWCNEEVYINNDKVKRKYMITELVKYSITPFLKKNGYVLGCSEHRLAECIARSLYYGRMAHEAINNDYRQEDYDHYYFVLDDDTWENFWSHCGIWSDIDENSTTNREGIRFCIWTLLDLYSSSRTVEVDEILGLTEEENDTTDTRDPYLVDSANGYFSAI